MKQFDNGYYSHVQLLKADIGSHLRLHHMMQTLFGFSGVAKYASI